MIATLFVAAQYDSNTSPTYPELIEIYKQLDSDHEEIELYNMGPSDFGLPIYLCVVNGARDSIGTFMRAMQETTLLINNAIHAGEPDGVNACLIWINNWIKSGKPRDIPLVGIIPAYNVGGMMNRSSSSRANQNGPEEYGFRGNAQNLDLNRDFIKMDSKNMFTFANIYQNLDPDVFIDTHVSNGADYQYYLTYIASVRERMAPATGELLYENLIPHLESTFTEKLFPIVPYVNMKGKTPDEGIIIFNDLPRYAMGYGTIMDAMSFTTETHMLKPFAERVKHTQLFIEETINWMRDNKWNIEKARVEALMWEEEMTKFKYDLKVTESYDSILFYGFDAYYPISEVTGKKLLKYDRNRPFQKYISYYNDCFASKEVTIPDKIILGSQCEGLKDRLIANGIDLESLDQDTLMSVNRLRVLDFKTVDKPYEGHFLHNDVRFEFENVQQRMKKGDWVISLDQPNKRFIMSLFVPDAPDSYFNWNYFDSYVQQKEYFSSYIFDEYAKQMLKENESLRIEFEAKKKSDKEFSDNDFLQLSYLYERSKFYEPTHNVLPYYFVEE